MTLLQIHICCNTRYTYLQICSRDRSISIIPSISKFAAAR